MKLTHSLLSLTLVGLTFIGCGGDKHVTKQYEVSITNLTVAQPMSPMTLIAHSSDYELYKIGSKASEALELLAEGGDNSALLALETTLTGTSGSGVILPGQTQTLTIETDADYLSFAAMLVNTNDAFTGKSSIDLNAVNHNEYLLGTYDAGTEKNSEEASSIPGPAGNGEGFNTVRDDSDIITNHAGVITQDEGFSTSVLEAKHKWDNPTAKLVIKKLN